MLWFNKRKKYAEYFKSEKECIERIKNAVSEKIGIKKFVEYDDFTVAFSGNQDNMELMLELYTVVDETGHYLHANIDDEVIFDECEFDSLDAFEASIVKYLTSRINRTIKTIITKDRHKSHHKSVYAFDNESENWFLIEDEHTEDSLVCQYFADKTETVEILKTYKLDI